MGLATIIRKSKLKERQMRILVLYLLLIGIAVSFSKLVGAWTILERVQW